MQRYRMFLLRMLQSFYILVSMSSSVKTKTNSLYPFYGYIFAAISEYWIAFGLLPVE